MGAPARPAMAAPAERGPRRLLFVLNSLCIGGAEKQVVSLLNGLDPATHEVSLVLLKDDRTLAGEIGPGRCRGGIVGLGVRRGLDLAAVRALARRIDDTRADIVVCTNMYAFLYAWLARRLARRGGEVRLVEVFHTTVPGSRREALQMHLYRHLVREADLLVYVCHAQAAHWRAQGLRARQEAVIHNGIDVARFAGFRTAGPGGARDGVGGIRAMAGTEGDATPLRVRLGFAGQDLVVGVCAALRPEKAQIDLVEAVARCRAARPAGPRVRALLIGDGPERPAIERRIDDLGLRAEVRLLGALTDVRPALAACDLMALSSRAVETFSIAALEAMALGLPVLLTDLGGARELVRPGLTGWLVPPGDVGALAATLGRLAHPSTRPDLPAMGRQAAADVAGRFTVPRMTEGYVRAFEGLLAPAALPTTPACTPARRPRAPAEPRQET